MTAAMRVRAARQARGWSQRKLALRAGVPQSTVGRVEAGLVDPRLSTVQRLLRACGEDFEAQSGEGVDRTQIWEILRLTPRDRLTLATSAAAALRRLHRARLR